ncbi:MAG: pentapeptide repeat-containing protein [SAR324 cluster bacterium]|nr:pentapeptide repeat-containing protein [SAR324 cluster bacterium]
MARKGVMTCRYLGSGGAPCVGEVQGKDGLCYWHDPGISKSGRGLKARLEAWAESGKSMEGFILKGADLEGVDLNHGDISRRVNLSNADLSRASLRGARLFNIDLRGSNLFKANFEDANLNHGHLAGANLLGVQLHDATLEQVEWGKVLPQQRQARNLRGEGSRAAARELYLEAEEICRNLSRAAAERGHFGLAGEFFYREMVMRRMQMRLGSRQWFTSKLMDLICGYGEMPVRVIGFSLSIILISAFLFFIFGVSGGGGAIVYRAEAGFTENLLIFLNCLYYSVVTFTTLGYGEIVPLGAVRAVAAVEAFIGAFTIGLFLVVFVKKMAR